MKTTILTGLIALIAGILIGYVVAPKETAMHSAMDGMTVALEGKEGDAFDEAFLHEMIVHHEGAVAMAELALESAERQEIKDLAKAIIAAQAVEIAQMKAWLMSWHGQAH